MSAYLVKLIDNNELVGLFVVDRLTDLGVAVDEICDPFACEFKPINRGAMLWMSQSGQFDDVNVDCSGVELSEDLEYRLRSGHWKPVAGIYKNPHQFFQVFMGK